MLSQVSGSQIYFAHPYSPWERGSNENANGLIREYLPKGVSLHSYDEGYIDQVQTVINNRPRKSLNYLSSQEVFNSLLPC